MGGEGGKAGAGAAAEQWRVFCAVELPRELRNRAHAHAAELRGRVQQARASWPRPENLHLTLKFIGEVERGRVEALSLAAGRAAVRCAPFRLTVEGAGTFPPRGLPRVLWLGVTDDSGGLARLQHELEAECESVGFAREGKTFRPHLTLARVRSPQGARELAELHRGAGFEAAEFQVGEIVILRSELGPGGSRYMEVSRHALSAPL